MYFDGAAFSREVRGDLSRAFSTSCIWCDSGTMSESKLRFYRAYAETNCNLVRHGRSTTSELGLILGRLELRSLIRQVCHAEVANWTASVQMGFLTMLCPLKRLFPLFEWHASVKTSYLEAKCPTPDCKQHLHSLLRPVWIAWHTFWCLHDRNPDAYFTRNLKD